MTPLESWISEARIGDMMTYGHQTETKYPPPNVMKVARDMAERGLVRLFVKRVGPSKVAYIAQRRDPPEIVYPPARPAPPVKRRPLVPHQNGCTCRLCRFDA